MFISPATFWSKFTEVRSGHWNCIRCWLAFFQWSCIWPFWSFKSRTARALLHDFKWLNIITAIVSHSNKPNPLQVPLGGAGPDAVEQRGAAGQPEAGRAGRGRGRRRRRKRRYSVSRNQHIFRENWTRSPGIHLFLSGRAQGLDSIRKNLLENSLETPLEITIFYTDTRVSTNSLSSV